MDAIGFLEVGLFRIVYLATKSSKNLYIHMDFLYLDFKQPIPRVRVGLYLFYLDVFPDEGALENSDLNTNQDSTGHILFCLRWVFEPM